MQRRGFTLIEIVLVMAIAGLILIIVVIAVFGAQQSRRDTQRRHDLARLAGQIETYASQNQGNYPLVNAGPNGFKGGFASSYLPNDFNDPLGQAPYVLELGFGGGCVHGAAALSPNGPGAISYDVPGANGNPYKLRMCLENGEYDIGT